jgi:hypothetical protein
MCRITDIGEWLPRSQLSSSTREQPTLAYAWDADSSMRSRAKMPMRHRLTVSWGMEEELPTRDRILLWTTLTMLLLAILTTPPSLTWPSYFLQLVAACLLLVVILVPRS